MKKRVMTIVGMAALSMAPTLVFAAGPTLYGRLNLGVASVDNGNATDNNTVGISDDASRIGIKGDEDLGDGLKAIYQFESLIDADQGGFQQGTTRTTGRDTFAGLQSEWGTVRLGFYNSAYKNLSTGVELFGDTIGDFTSYNAGTGTNSTALAAESRLANTISYTSPTFSGFYGTVDFSRGETGTSTESNPITIGLSYKTDAFYVGVGHYDADNTGTSGIDDAQKLVGSVTVGAFTLIGVLETQSAKGALSATNAEVDTTHLGLAYKLNGKDTLAATWTDYDSSTASTDASQVALGWFHAFSKNTTLKFVWTEIDNDAASANPGRVVGPNTSIDLANLPNAGSDPSGFQIQLALVF